MRSRSISPCRLVTSCSGLRFFSRASDSICCLAFSRSERVMMELLTRQTISSTTVSAANAARAKTTIKREEIQSLRMEIPLFYITLEGSCGLGGGITGIKTITTSYQQSGGAIGRHARIKETSARLNPLEGGKDAA